MWREHIHAKGNVLAQFDSFEMIKKKHLVGCFIKPYLRRERILQSIALNLHGRPLPSSVMSCFSLDLKVLQSTKPACHQLVIRDVWPSHNCEAIAAAGLTARNLLKVYQDDFRATCAYLHFQ